MRRREGTNSPLAEKMVTGTDPHFLRQSPLKILDGYDDVNLESGDTKGGKGWPQSPHNKHFARFGILATTTATAMIKRLDPQQQRMQVSPYPQTHKV
jgi:hypothetical protein